MIGRVLLAAVLAGLAAGLIMGVIQHVRLTPMIIQAETFEHVAHGHGTATHVHGDHVWSPEDGLERTLFTTLAAMITGAGFALAMAGVSLLSGLAITSSNGMIWGLCGFLTVSFAPAIGLPPELPGMPAGDLTFRQMWWITTLLLTGTGLYLLATRTSKRVLATAILCLLAPHIMGAPQPATNASSVPPGLASAFATSSLAANLVFWVLIGVFLTWALARLEKDLAA